MSEQSMVEKHTPGPWCISRDPRPDMEWNNSIAVAAKPHLEICSMNHCGDPWNEQDEANASLIAAAPDLLAACRKAKALLQPELVKEPDRSIFWELVAAIAKAEGRS